MILFRVFKDKFMMIIFKNCSNGSINTGEEDERIRNEEQTNTTKKFGK